MMVRFSTAQQKMVDSDQTQREQATAKENGILFRFSILLLKLVSQVSQTSQKVRDGHSLCFYRPLEKAERRRKKNRKKKEKKKEKKKAQKQNEGSPGENQLLVLSLLSARFSLLIAYVSNNLGSKRVTFMQLSTTISNRK